MKLHLISIGGILMTIGFVLSRCSKEHLDNVPKIIWRTPITIQRTFGSFIPTIVTFKNKVVISIDSSLSSAATPVLLLDKNTGSLTGKWTDFVEPTKDIITSRGATHVYNEKISFATRDKIFTINANNGQTLFKHWDNGYAGLHDVIGLEGKLYRHLTNKLYDNNSEDYIKEYNLITGDMRIIYSVKGKDNYQTGLRYPTFFIDKIGDTIMLIANMTYNFTTKSTKPFFIKYNVTKKVTIFEKEWVHNETGSCSAPPLIKDGKVYVTLGRKIICVDLETGETLWTRFLQSIVAFSDPIIAQNTFYVIDEERQLYALDLNTGNILWQTEGSGSSSNLAYLNGVLYFTGGGDGLLHAVEASNGQHIYKFRCPDEAINSNFWWQRGVTVDPETKRLYVASYGSLFCLTAVR